MNTIKKINLNPFKKVFILGGTSEIAQEICYQLLKKGTNKIHFVSRNLKKTEAFKKKITSQYNVQISMQEIDLLNDDLNTLPNIEFFDLYIIATGYLGNSILANNNLEEASKIARVNYYSLIPWLSAITSENRINKKGAIWILSSVAGDIGRPSNYHYGAAKAALTIHCEGLLNRCHNKPFKVRIIKAGLINTTMSWGKASPILYKSKKYLANNLIKSANNEGVEYWPWWWRVIIMIVSLLPRKLISKL
tara:strand:+ start:291 stop:1037 length:747 start_codon:yes stop_codon:yes gene_type:complete